MARVWKCLACVGLTVLIWGCSNFSGTLSNTGGATRTGTVTLKLNRGFDFSLDVEGRVSAISEDIGLSYGTTPVINLDQWAYIVTENYRNVTTINTTSEVQLTAITASEIMASLPFNTVVLKTREGGFAKFHIVNTEGVIRNSNGFTIDQSKFAYTLEWTYTPNNTDKF